MSESFIRKINSPEEMEKIISEYANSSVEKDARKQLKAGANLLEVSSPFFQWLQDMGSNMFFHELSNIMKNELNATHKDYWVLNVTLPKRPKEPVVYVILKKNM